MEKVIHEIQPIYNENSKILILGSFPSVKSREGAFFYHHPQNRFWKVLAQVLECTVPITVAEKKAMLLEHGVAVWDVIYSCTITGSSDSSIRDVVANDIKSLIQETSITTIYANGGTAHKLYAKYCEAQTGIAALKLPSSSPANAAFSLERLVESWVELRLSLV